MSEDRDEARLQQRAQLKKFLEFSRVLPTKRRYRIDTEEAAQLLQQSKALQEPPGTGEAAPDDPGSPTPRRPPRPSTVISTMGLRELRELHTRTLDSEINATTDAVSNLSQTLGRMRSDIMESPTFGKRLTPVVDYEDATGMDALSVEWDRPILPAAMGSISFTPRSTHGNTEAPPSPVGSRRRRGPSRSIPGSQGSPLGRRTPFEGTRGTRKSVFPDAASARSTQAEAFADPQRQVVDASSDSRTVSDAKRRGSVFKPKLKDTGLDYEVSRTQRAQRVDGVIKKLVALMNPVEEERESAVCGGAAAAAPATNTGVSLLGFTEASSRAHQYSPTGSPRLRTPDQHPLYTLKAPMKVPQIAHDTTVRKVVRPKSHGSYAPTQLELHRAAPIVEVKAHAPRTRLDRHAIAGAVGLSSSEGIASRPAAMQKRSALSAKMAIAWLPNATGGKFPTVQQGPLPERADAYKLQPR